MVRGERDCEGTIDFVPAEAVDQAITHPASSTAPHVDPHIPAPIVTVPVQVNGRTRFRIQAPAGSAEEVIEQLVRSHPEYANYAADGALQRMVIVPDRIVNMIIR